MIEESTCLCTNWANTNELRRCLDHHRLWRGPTRLASVTSIVGASFPLDPSIPPEVLENARDRGAAVDDLFGSYVLGQLRSIPSGTREDVVSLFTKLVTWYQKQNFSTVAVQLLCGAEDHAGVIDFTFDSMPVELKSTYEILPSHRLQTAAYETLLERSDAMILHVTQRLKEPRLVAITDDDRKDWQTALEWWRMKARRSPKEQWSDETLS